MNTMILMVLKVLVSVAFLVSGIAKLSKAEPLVKQFHEFRLPLDIMYLIGIAEISCGIAVWFDSLTLWAFSCLGLLMLGAIKNHHMAKHAIMKSMPSLVLLGLCVGGALMDNWLN